MLQTNNVESILHLCKRFNIAVDVGAYRGEFTIFSAAMFNQVYAFEPFIKSYDVLKENCASYKNVILENIALGEADKKSTMVYNDLYANCSRVKDFCDGTENNEDFPGFTKKTFINSININIKTLDSYNLPYIDFLKIDVEGYEVEVIKGAIKTLERTESGIIIFETFNMARLQTIDSMLEYSNYYPIKKATRYDYVYVKGI
jgi:FkbM family methyltransferase